MEFIKPGINIDFVGKRRAAFVLSGIMIIATIVTLIWRGGPNYGVDFSGGVLIQVRLSQKETLTDLRKALEAVQLQDSIYRSSERKGRANI